MSVESKECRDLPRHGTATVTIRLSVFPHSIPGKSNVLRLDNRKQEDLGWNRVTLAHDRGSVTSLRTIRLHFYLAPRRTVDDPGCAAASSSNTPGAVPHTPHIKSALIPPPDGRVHYCVATASTQSTTPRRVPPVLQPLPPHTTSACASSRCSCTYLRRRRHPHPPPPCPRSPTRLLDIRPPPPPPPHPLPPPTSTSTHRDPLLPPHPAWLRTQDRPLVVEVQTPTYATQSRAWTRHARCYFFMLVCDSSFRRTITSVTSIIISTPAISTRRAGQMQTKPTQMHEVERLKARRAVLALH
ncbi:hypothetical protein MSAN_01194500 [Mycena sanguinolenta]|uniref:Uncharacterized protein n=1 Tax=Mycena sanguinolenta TaxID=230812 RepID=A0A8H6YCI1_9AGAR|nr:hypothetical protein MSAN_01194500 [Mycena sanguinolenta]